MVTEAVMDPDNKHPPPLPRGRVRSDASDTSTQTHTEQHARKQEPVRVEAVIGCACIAIRIEQYFYYPDVISFGRRPYKTGPRKGRLYRIRICGERRKSRVIVQRFFDPEPAARMYHALRHELLAASRLPMRSFPDGSLVMMGAAFLTYRGAMNDVGQAFARFLRQLGVPVARDPLTERASQEFWFVDW
jgi:hypothetical protein